MYIYIYTRIYGHASRALDSFEDRRISLCWFLPLLSTFALAQPHGRGTNQQIPCQRPPVVAETQHGRDFKKTQERSKKSPDGAHSARLSWQRHSAEETSRETQQSSKKSSDGAQEATKVKAKKRDMWAHR